jgi:hypothetical protein
VDHRLICAAVATVALAVMATACKTTSDIAFVNPSDQPMFVQVDEKAPFEVGAGATVKRALPALDRLTPITIVARDARGATLFAVTTSVPQLEAAGHRLELKATGPTVDPLIQQYAGFP